MKIPASTQNLSFPAPNFFESPHVRVWKFAKESLTFQLIMVTQILAFPALLNLALGDGLHFVCFSLLPVYGQYSIKNFVYTSDKEYSLKPF